MHDLECVHTPESLQSLPTQRRAPELRPDLSERSKGHIEAVDKGTVEIEQDVSRHRRSQTASRGLCAVFRKVYFEAQPEPIAEDAV